MSELKTLKDFEHKENDATISKIELKAEAIKIINSEVEVYYDDWRDMFKWFFNITEEDLK